MSESSLLIGGRYQRLDKLETREAGDVYRGLDTQTGEPVAIKCLSRDLAASNPQLLEHLIREGESLRQLDHPHIVRMLAAVEEGGQFYLIMEYVGGESLRQRLAHEPLPSLKVVLSIALDLADTLTDTHRHHIIHHDLKPANVLLTENGETRLANFGTAFLLDTAQPAPEAATTYSSPETISGQPTDGRVDIWALGILLFEMLTGFPPFSAPHLDELKSAILRQPLPDLEALRSDLPIGLVDLIYRMLEKDPAARISDIQLVGLELQALCQDAMPDAKLSCRTLAERSRGFAAPPAEPHLPTHNLPVQTTVFVGRQDELDVLERLIADPATRLITILGQGGMGKTQLALEFGARHLAHFPNGVYSVSLAPLTDPANIIPAIAEAVGIQLGSGGLGHMMGEAPDSRMQFLNYFHSKRLLLIMDNFEHLLDGADLLTDIVQAAPGVKILVTSRERLNLSSEILFPLGGMEYPNWTTPQDALRYDAVRLFLQSARRVAPGFELQPADLGCVARICWLVGGMPLGIVLAAAWVDMFSVQEIADEIGQDLDFLETTFRDVPDRHRSMRAVFDSAWKQLGEAEQRIMESLSVFRGGFTRDAAQQVAGAYLRTLTRLVNKSLLRRDPASGRFEIHDLLRQYAQEQLVASGDGEANCDRHCVYYAELAGRREDKLLFEIPREVLAEFDNLRLAWEWGLTRLRLDDLRRLWPLLFDICQQQSFVQQAYNLFAPAAAILRVAEPSRERDLLLGLALAIQGGSAISLGRRTEGTALIEEGLAILELRGWSLERLMAEPYRFRSSLDKDPSQARRRLEEYLAFSQAMGVHQLAALALASLAGVATQEGNAAEAIRLCHQSVAVARESGSLYCLVRNLSNLLALAWTVGCWDAEIEQYPQELIRIGRQHNIPYATCAGLNSLAYAALRRNALTQAEPLAQEALALAEEIGGLSLRWIARDTLGTIQFALGDLEQAYPLFQQNHVEMLDTGSTFMLSRTYSQLGFVALASGTNSGQAERYFIDSLALAIYPREQVDSLVGVAMLAAQNRNPERAVELLAVASAYHFPDIHSNEAIRLRAELEASIPPTTFAAAWEQGTSRTLDEVIGGLLGKVPAQTSQPLPDPLSERELEVLRLVAAGLSNQEIADRLVISLGTVKIHTHNIYLKLNVESRTRAIVRARELGLLGEDQ